MLAQSNSHSHSHSHSPFNQSRPYPVGLPGRHEALAHGEARAAEIARVKAALLRSAQHTLDSEGFTQVIAPTFTHLSGACGEPGTLIPVEISGGMAYLRQTAQLHLEPLMRELGAVYSVGRSFRAEHRSSARHLTEFTLIEAEAQGWNLSRLMSLMERLVVGMLRHVLESTPTALKALRGAGGLQFFEGIEAPFKRMTYDQALIELQKMGYFIEWGEDLRSEHEIALADLARAPLFVTHYPVETRFFTMKVCRRDPRVVECCDLLLPGVGEVMGASETETNADILETRLEGSRSVRQAVDLGGSAEDYDWYLQMRRANAETQSGFGMGFERVVRFVCDLPSVAHAV